MNIVDAAYHTVHDYPGGSVALAPRMGMSSAVLRNKVNPNNCTHHLTLVEADRMVGLTGDMRLVQAFGATHGFGLVRLTGEQREDGSTLAAVLSRDSASGGLSATLAAALADGVITPRECDEVNQAGLAVQSAVVALLAHVAGRVPLGPNASDRVGG